MADIKYAKGNVCYNKNSLLNVFEDFNFLLKFNNLYGLKLCAQVTKDHFT